MAGRHLFLGFLLLFASSVDSKKRQAKSRRPLIAYTGPTDEDISESGLLDPALSVSTIYEKSRQFHSATHVKQFSGSVLGYVTPWNRHGYELAVTFRHKLTHVSPVWYTLKHTPDKAKVTNFYLEGGHEHNATWLAALRQPSTENHIPLVVPRFILQLEVSDLYVLLNNPAQAAAVMLHEVEACGYDGMVLETWLHWVAVGGMADPAFKQHAFTFIRFLATKLHESSPPRQLLLAVPPFLGARYNSPSMSVEHWAELADVVDGWSVMTYDYSQSDSPGPNAPLHWFKGNVDVVAPVGTGDDGDLKQLLFEQHKQQLLLGVNFYGYDFNVPHRHASAITADGYLPLLARHQPPLSWLGDDIAEHVFEYKEPGNHALHQVYFPTCASLHHRLKAAEELRVGISIWELGQGLERFLDLL